MKITIVTAIAAVLIAVGLAAAPTASATEGCGHEDQSVATDCFEPGGPEVTPQLPDEDEGRQQDCPDGQVGTVHNHVLVCPDPIAVETPELEAPPVVVEEPAPVVEEPVVVTPEPAPSAEPVASVAPLVVEEPPATAPAAAPAVPELAYTGIRDYTPALAAGGVGLVGLGIAALLLGRRRT